MLVSVACLAGSNARTTTGCFFCAFGIWDIAYYVGLRWLTGWPKGLLDWDCLFFIPKPWYGPVLAPILISAYFCGACLLIHAREARGRPLRMTKIFVTTQLLSFALWYGSFVKDADRISANGFAGIDYSWALFAAGAVVGCAGLALGCKPWRPRETGGPA